MPNKEKTKFGKFLQKVGNTFEDVAEVGGNLLQGTAAGMALNTVSDILSGKSNNPALSPEEQAAARAFQQELERDRQAFERELVRMQVEDMEGARKYNADIQNDPDATQLAKFVPYAIDIAVVGTWIGCTFYIASQVFRGMDVSDGIWGLYSTVTGLATQIIGFHRGSSIGQKRSENKALNPIKAL